MRQVQQNLLTVDAAGNVGAVFPGGVEMPVDTTWFSATPTSSLRWRDTVTKGIRGVVYSGAIGGQNRLTLSAGDGANLDDAQLVIQNSAPGAGNFITASVNSGAGALILDSSARSQFVQWSSGVQARKVGLYAAQIRFAGPISTGVTVTFPNVPAGVAIYMWNGSFYQNTPGATGLIDCFRNGGFVSNVQIFCNESFSHKIGVPLTYVDVLPVTTNVTMGMATNAANGTLSDANDVFQCTLIVL